MAPSHPEAVALDLSHLFFSASSPQQTRKSQREARVESKTAPKKVLERRLSTLSTFTEWTNYTLDPTIGSNEEDHPLSGFGVIVEFEQQQRRRQRALDFWQSSEMQTLRDKMKDLINRGRIKIREDRDMHSDLTLRKQILSLLFSYSTSWLALALETITGEQLLPETPKLESSPRKLSDGIEIHAKPTASSNAKRKKSALRSFIVDRVLTDQKVLQKYTKRQCKAPSHRFEAKYRTEIRELVLYRLLMLFFFLDRAKELNLLKTCPRLFTQDAAIKSTRAMLLAFCKHFLSKEGDFVKRLTRLGLKVSCRQEPLDEIQFQLSNNNNLETDFSDGVLLARLTEVVTQVPFKSVLLQLKLPAVTRPQKLHNIRLLLSLLQKHKLVLPEEVAARPIVDGEGGHAMKLVRSLVLRHNLSILVDEGKLRTEIHHIEQMSEQQDDDEESLMLPDDSFQEGRLRLLLLRWCDTVCEQYGIDVSNLTTDFADGIVVCTLLHYYLPSLLRLQEIRPTSRATKFHSPAAASSLSSEALFENERCNCSLANDKTAMLGGLKQVLPISDSCNMPDPKAVLLCLAFLFARLPHFSRKTVACQRIQRMYRALSLKRTEEGAGDLPSSKELDCSSGSEDTVLTSNCTDFQSPVPIRESSCADEEEKVDHTGLSPAVEGGPASNQDRCRGLPHRQDDPPVQQQQLEETNASWSISAASLLHHCGVVDFAKVQLETAVGFSAPKKQPHEESKSSSLLEDDEPKRRRLPQAEPRCSSSSSVAQEPSPLQPRHHGKPQSFTTNVRRHGRHSSKEVGESFLVRSMARTQQRLRASTGTISTLQRLSLRRDNSLPAGTADRDEAWQDLCGKWTSLHMEDK